MIAIGRSTILYNSIQYLVEKGQKFDAIVSSEGYPEYKHGLEDFKILAQSIDVPFYNSNHLLDEDILNEFQNQDLRIGISSNWKFFIPEKIIRIFNYNLLNFHLGNLPDYKGNATANWSIINGEDHIYANVHRMALSLDSGAVICREYIPINKNTYVGDVIEKAEKIAPLLFEKAINNLKNDPSYYEIEGSEQGSRCFPRNPEDGKITWNQPVTLIDRLVRSASEPYPGAYCNYKGEKMIIWRGSPSNLDRFYYAIPGSILEINKDQGFIKVASNDGVYKIEWVEYSGYKGAPSKIVKSIRDRLTD